MLIFIGCNPTKTLKEHEEILLTNKIKVDNGKIDKDEIYSIIKQKPNKKILGVFRFHLGVYNLFSNKKESKFRDNVGEAPVIYDSLLTERSIKQLELYLDNKGFFQNQVSVEKTVKKQKVTQSYIIKAGAPYLINNINYKFNDPSLGGYVLSKKDYSLIKKGRNFDVDVLDKERERIKNTLKNYGYYYFTNNSIKYMVDTTIGNQKVDILIELLEDKVEIPESDSTYFAPHKKYTINNINMFMGSKSTIERTSTLDTIEFKGANIYYIDKLKFKPKMLTHTLNFKPKEEYSLQDQNNTYKQLSGLKLFKNVSIIYEEIDSNRLNANIYLAPLVFNSYTLEGVGTNTGGDLGVEGNIIYQNKNIFRGGELFNVKLKGGLQIQRVVGVSNSANEIFGTPFNTLEFGPEASLEFPRFLLPVNLENFSKRSNPKTIINTSLNFQQRPEYARNLIQGAFSYSWSETQFKNHYITPFNISFVKLELTDDFKNTIIAENNPFLLNSYTDHFISAIQYSFMFNNQELNRLKNYQYFKFNVETSGNMLSTYNRVANNPKDPITNSYTFAGIRYAEYFKSEIDVRFYQNKHTTNLVERFNLGIGVPYGNLDVLPFEKSFFGGGSNGIRAWPARRLGPGSLSDSLQNSANQIGELKIEANIEYRFDITKLFKGAFFVDAGNTWLNNANAQLPGAEFNFNSFYKQVAVGMGMGLRIDVHFFVLRLDLGIPVRKPWYTDGQQWQFNNFNLNSATWRRENLILNLAFGYPF